MEKEHREYPVDEWQFDRYEFFTVKQAALLNKDILIGISKQIRWEDQFNVCCYSATLQV